MWTPLEGKFLNEFQAHETVFDEQWQGWQGYEIVLSLPPFELNDI
jgi:hypothetical protein